MKIVADPINYIRHFTFQRWVSRPEGDKKLQEALEDACPENNDFVNTWTKTDGLVEGGQKRDEVQLIGAATPAIATHLLSGLAKIDLRIVLCLYNKEDEDLTAVVHVSSDKASAIAELARWFDMNDVSVWSYAKLREHEDHDELRICIDHSALAITPFTLSSGQYVKNIAVTLQCLVERTANILNNDDPNQVFHYPSPISHLGYGRHQHSVKPTTNDTNAPE